MILQIKLNFRIANRHNGKSLVKYVACYTVNPKWKGGFMEELHLEFWLQVIIYILTFSFSAGIIWQKVHHIDKRLDRLEKLITRMYDVEREADAAHNRIDNVESDMEDKNQNHKN